MPRVRLAEMVGQELDRGLIRVHAFGTGGIECPETVRGLRRVIRMEPKAVDRGISRRIRQQDQRNRDARVGQRFHRDGVDRRAPEAELATIRPPRVGIGRVGGRQKRRQVHVQCRVMDAEGQRIVDHLDLQSLLAPRDHGERGQQGRPIEPLEVTHRTHRPKISSLRPLPKKESGGQTVPLPAALGHQPRNPQRSSGRGNARCHHPRNRRQTFVRAQFNDIEGACRGRPMAEFQFRRRGRDLGDAACTRLGHTEPGQFREPTDPRRIQSPTRVLGSAWD